MYESVFEKIFTDSRSPGFKEIGKKLSGPQHGIALCSDKPRLNQAA